MKETINYIISSLRDYFILNINLKDFKREDFDYLIRALIYNRINYYYNRETNMISLSYSYSSSLLNVFDNTMLYYRINPIGVA